MSFGLHQPVQVVKDRMGPQGLDCRFRGARIRSGCKQPAPYADGGPEGEVFDCVVQKGSLESGPFDVGRRFTPGRRVMDDASMQMRTSLVEKDRGSQS